MLFIFKKLTWLDIKEYLTVRTGSHRRILLVSPHENNFEYKKTDIVPYEINSYTMKFQSGHIKIMRLAL
jgi:hypothetical protein